MGLFAIGDFDMYSKSSELWQKIVTHLKMQNQIGKALSLQCQNHPDDEPLMVETADDFKNAPDGGCKRNCDYRLDCGHVCKRRCHPYDREHMDYMCKEPCYRTCANNHPCKCRCSDVCRCNELIVKQLDCGHEISIPCGNENDFFECTEKCTKTLPCGHACTRKCNEQCYPCREDVDVKFPGCGHLLKTHCFLKNKPCTLRCQETLNCGHTCQFVCSSVGNKDISTHLQWCKEGHTSSCKERCKKILECGHRCSGACNNCLKNGFHTLCAIECKCTLICGHDCKGQCQSCELCTRRYDRTCVHGLLGNICKEDCRRCQKPCPWVCDHLRCSKKCGEPCDRPRCNKPCTRILPCKHACSGLCGDPCPSVCVKCGEAEVAVFKDHDRNSDIAVVQLDDCGHLIQRELMDQYIDSENACVLKKCLVCSKPVYTTNGNRYEHDLNITFANIDKIKRAVRLFSKKYIPSDRHHLNWVFSELNRMSLCMFLKKMSSDATDLLEQKISQVDTFGEQIIRDVVEYLNKTNEAVLGNAPVNELLESSAEIESFEERGSLDQLQQIVFEKKILSYNLDLIPDSSEIEQSLENIVKHEIQKLHGIEQLNFCKVGEHDVSISSANTTSTMSTEASFTERDKQQQEKCTKLSQDEELSSQNEDVSTLPQKKHINSLSETEISTIGDEDARPSPDSLNNENYQGTMDENSSAGSRHTVIYIPYVTTTSRYFQNKPSSDVFKRFKSMTKVIKIEKKKERKRENALVIQDKSPHFGQSKKIKLTPVCFSTDILKTTVQRTEQLDTKQLIPESRRMPSRGQVATVTAACAKEQNVEDKRIIFLAPSPPERQSSPLKMHDSSENQSAHGNPQVISDHHQTQVLDQGRQTDVTQPVNVNEVGPADLRWQLSSARTRKTNNIWTTSQSNGSSRSDSHDEDPRRGKKRTAREAFHAVSSRGQISYDDI